jgi:hypothetical protein
MYLQILNKKSRLIIYRRLLFFWQKIFKHKAHAIGGFALGEHQETTKNTKED